MGMSHPAGTAAKTINIVTKPWKQFPINKIADILTIATWCVPEMSRTTSSPPSVAWWLLLMVSPLYYTALETVVVRKRHSFSSPSLHQLCPRPTTPILAPPSRRRDDTAIISRPQRRRRRSPFASFQAPRLLRSRRKRKCGDRNSPISRSGDRRGFSDNFGTDRRSQKSFGKLVESCGTECAALFSIFFCFCRASIPESRPSSAPPSPPSPVSFVFFFRRRSRPL